MKAGRIRVSYQVLDSLLSLPEGHHVVNIVSDRYDLRTFEVMVGGPDLPEVADGEAIGEVALILTATYAEDCGHKTEVTGRFQVPGPLTPPLPHLPLQ